MDEAAAGDDTVNPRVAIDAVRVTLELTREEARDLELYADRLSGRRETRDLVRLRLWRKVVDAVRQAKVRRARERALPRLARRA